MSVFFQVVYTAGLIGGGLLGASGILVSAAQLRTPYILMMGQVQSTLSPIKSQVEVNISQQQVSGLVEEFIPDLGAPPKATGGSGTR